MTFLLGIWLAVAGLGGAALSALGVLYRLEAEPRDYFPGDAPLADLCVEFALAGWLFMGLGLAAARAMSRLIEPGGLLRVAARGVLVLLALSVASLAPALKRVGERHFGEWRQLKALLAESAARVHEHARARGEVLSREEFERARTWLQEHPVSFRFKDMPHPVEVQMMTSHPPYVGVHFGDGKHAVFHPVTMLCTYAD